MKPNPVHRLPAPLEAAIQRIKLAARDAAERTIESLGLAALASGNAFQRDGLLGAQFELNRKSAIFVLAFNDALDERVLRELGPRAVGPTGAGGIPGLAMSPAAPPTSWDALSLVDDREVEAQISADRFGMEIAFACEWELRELDAYVGALLVDAGGESERNPMRPDIVGHAMIRGLEAVSERADIRKVLTGEMSRSMGALLPAVYAGIVADWRHAGVQPMGLAVRNRPPREGVREAAAGERMHEDDAGEDVGGDDRRSRYGAVAGGGADSRLGGRPAGGGLAPTARAGGPVTRSGTPLGQVDPALMSVIRRLAQVGPQGAVAPGDRAGYAYEDGAAHGEVFDDGHAPALPNLIRAHRDELRQASQGGLDHMVIDVIGFLFDQILADPKVPPQMARQIARLQLPVLRAALGDPGFFSTRKHPVRRFINRIASLGAGFDDFDDEQAKAFLAKVRELVQEVVEGDFDQIEIYEQKLAALEQFVNEASAQGAGGAGDDAAALLSQKEDEIRLHQLYAQRLAGELKDISAPEFLRDFVSRVWSQVLLRASAQGGPEGALAQRLRRVGRELFLSVQAKATPAHRKAFLAELPRLMQDLTEGMNLIAWPEAQRRAFFGQLMPAHADALKRPPARPLDVNLMARQIEGALDRPLPSKADLKAAPALPLPAEEVAQARFSADEAKRAGLVDEASVNWSGHVDIEVGGGADLDVEASASLPDLPGVPTPSEPPEPTRGHALADAVEVGFAYQMHLDNAWHKVRLSHISPGRAFFMFTYGGRHRKTVSLTQRMLQRLCDTGRMRSFEDAALIERATARARRQLAALGQGALR